MADSNISSLPQAAQLGDDSLLVAEQQGQAVKVTGAQFKEFGRQAVIGQVQGYVDRAEAAADRAVDAVSAVTDMTVEAAALASGQDATVTKTIKDGKVDLAFGLPRGEQGIPGPAGDPGPRGPQGPTGKGLTILGYYDTVAALEAAVPSPETGDAYGVGTEAPYSIYVFDGVTGAWKDNGHLSGGGGGPLPENVVTAEGGASMSFPIDLGDGPHTITFVDEEGPPLTAGDIAYEMGTVEDALDGLKSSVSNGKSLIASAITDKGVDTAQDATFQQMAENIGQISGGSDTSDATATSFDILAPKTAYTANGKVAGVIPTLAAQTITPGTADKTISNGQYLGGTQTIKGDPNLTSSNIKRGVTLFGVAGALESSFKATLTATADIGAVVTATHSGGTEVEALSTTGTVVLELPLEGTWSVTAVRGTAQYNTVTLQVSSQYSAALTAEVHILYYGMATRFTSPAMKLAAATAGDKAIFAGGDIAPANPDYGSRFVYAYDEYLSFSAPEGLVRPVNGLCGAAIGDLAFFAGGYNGYYTDHAPYYDEVTTYTGILLTKGTVASLSIARSGLSGTSIGDFVIFAGGTTGTPSAAADSYDKYGTKWVIVDLFLPMSSGAVSSNRDYAVFCGGESATAYDKDLTRTAIPKLSSLRSGLAAAAAGNYVLFAGGGLYRDTVDAYDLFLTRTTAEVLQTKRTELAGVTLGSYGIFWGGRSSMDEFPPTADAYDSYLTHTTAQTSVSTGTAELAATAIGDYALFGGGAYRLNGEDRYSAGVVVFQRI